MVEFEHQSPNCQEAVNFLFDSPITQQVEEDEGRRLIDIVLWPEPLLIDSRELQVLKRHLLQSIKVGNLSLQKVYKIMQMACICHNRYLQIEATEAGVSTDDFCKFNELALGFQSLAATSPNH